MRQRLQGSRSRLGWTLALTSLAFFMVGLDALVVITALPAIHRDLGASLASLQWTVNAYSLAWAASIMTAAALGDRYGRRLWFVIGLTLFAVASATCALAPDMMLRAPGIMRLLSYLSLPFSISPQKGARTTVYLASGSDVRDVSGYYFTKSKMTGVNNKFDTAANRALLWDLSLKFVQKHTAMPVLGAG